jgi:hypothetical protein
LSREEREAGEGKSFRIAFATFAFFARTPQFNLTRRAKRFFIPA